MSTPALRLSGIQNFALPPKKRSASMWQVIQVARSIVSTGRTKCMPLARSVATKAQTVRRFPPTGSVHMPRRP